MYNLFSLKRNPLGVFGVVWAFGFAGTVVWVVWGRWVVGVIACWHLGRGWGEGVVPRAALGPPPPGPDFP